MERGESSIGSRGVGVDKTAVGFRVGGDRAETSDGGD